MDNRASEWDASYDRGENNVYSPCEEVVRFFARYIRRRRGLSQFVDVCPGARGSRLLDLGCGIGRNLIYSAEMGLVPYGLDLSPKATQIAREWMAQRFGEEYRERIITGDVRSLPWSNGFFAHAIADSVLDSMPMEMARVAVKEVARTMARGGYFYCSLISRSRFAGEEVVTEEHERNTVQSYFDMYKIRTLFHGSFELERCEHHIIEDVLRGEDSGRYHVVLRRD